MLFLLGREIIRLQEQQAPDRKESIDMTHSGWSYFWTVAVVGITVMVLGYIAITTFVLPAFEQIHTALSAAGL